VQGKRTANLYFIGYNYFAKNSLKFINVIGRSAEILKTLIKKIAVILSQIKIFCEYNSIKQVTR